MFNKRFIAYVAKEDLLAGVKAVDLIDQTVTLQDEEENEAVFAISETELLEEVGVFNGVTVFNRDVFQRTDGKLLEVELQKDGQVVFYELGAGLERGKSGTAMNAEVSLKRIEQHNTAELVGNIYELEVIEEEVFDFGFNVKVVKDFNGEYYTYYYACNNKAKEEIDLIKVVFVGHQLIKEEEYQRDTVSYEEFAEAVHTGELEEVSQQELANYAYGVLAGAKSDIEDDYDYEEEYEEDFEDEDFDEDFEDEDGDACVVPTCQDCEEEVDNCTCSPW
jgi:hypothetical protein